MKKIKFGIIALLLETFLVSCSAVNPHEHSFEVTKIDPTCTQKGQIMLVCKSCGYTNTLDIDPTGHQGPISYDTDYHWRTCSTCNQIYDKELHKTPNAACDCGYIGYSTGLSYYFFPDHVEVTGIGTCLDSKIVIPSSYNGIPVTTISRNTFSYCSFITEVVLPNTITEIGRGCFAYCTSLVYINLPDSLQSLDYGIGVNGCFYNCTSLTSIKIPKNLTYIDDAFTGCTSLSNISVDDDNPKYDSRNNCNAVIDTNNNTLILGCFNTVIPDSVTSLLGTYISFPKNIFIPKTVTNIGEGSSNPFRGCFAVESIVVDKDNPVYDSRNNCNAIIKTSDNKLLVSCKNTILDNTIEKIGSYAFYKSNFSSITIPNGVTEIGEGAFSGCESLVSIDLPDSISQIGKGAFSRCESLVSIDLPDSISDIWQSTFFGCSALVSIEIPGSVEFIDWYAFYGCSALSSVIFLNRDTFIVIRDGAFVNCTSLSSLYVYNPRVSMSVYAFSNCPLLVFEKYDNGAYVGNDSNPYLIFIGLEEDEYSNLKTIKIHKDCKMIAYGTLRGNALEKIYIPRNVEYIPYCSGAGQTGRTIYCEAESKPEGWADWWAFVDQIEGCTIIWNYKDE